MQNFEPIVVEFITSMRKGGGSKKSEKDKEEKSIFGAAFDLTKVFNITNEIYHLIREGLDGIIKPIKTALLGVIKLVAQLLRPVADVILLILQPILLFLKPIIKVFNDIMRPFRTLAFGLMKQASEAFKSGNMVQGSALSGLAITTIFTGLANALLGVIGELVKMMYSTVVDMIKFLFINPLLNVFGGMITFFGGNVDEIRKTLFDSLDTSKVLLNNLIDNTLTTLQASSLIAITGLATKIVGNDSEGLKMLENTATNAISVASDNVKKKMQAAIDNMFNVTMPGKKTMSVNSGQSWEVNNLQTSMSRDLMSTIKSNGKTYANGGLTFSN